MATFTGSRGGGSTGPYLTLDYNVVETDVANNRSKVRLVLKLNASHRINFSASKSGVLQGSGFSYTRGASGTGSWTLRTQDVWVGHNSDGSKSQSFSGSFNIAISYSGSHVGTLRVSGTATLPVIPRASTLSAFSFGSHLQPSTAVTINYTVSRKSGNFRHQIQLRDGSHVVQTWDNISSNGASAVTLSTASVNSLLNRMSNTTSRSLTLRVATRSGIGGGWIGSAVTRNATATVNANVKPSVSALSVSQTGNTISSNYLQGKSRVTASFTRSGGYGATITSSSITVRRKTTNNDVQTINSNSGTTGRAVNLSGAYEAQGMARDSRGRTTYTSWTDFAVTAYSGPRITNFTAVRDSEAETIVSISRAGTHTPLGGSNVLTYTVQRRIGTGAWSDVDTDATGTSTTASFSGTSTSTDNAVTASYDFRLVVTDKFGESAESIITVSTQRVVLDVHKNEGVGIGKIHEKGVLDIDGDVYSNGILYTVGGLGSIEIPAEDDLNNYTNNGFYHNSLDSDTTTIANIPETRAFSLLVQKHTGTQQTFTSYGGPSGTNFAQYIRHYYNGSWGQWVRVDSPETGTNTNGNWVRFNSGIQICWHRWSIDTEYPGGDAYLTRNVLGKLSFPQQFLTPPSVTLSGEPAFWSGVTPDVSKDYGAINLTAQHSTNRAVSNSSFQYRAFFNTFRGNVAGQYIAIGRWK